MKSFLLLILLFSSSMIAKAQHQLIPVPVSYESTEALFMLDNQVTLDIRTDNIQVIKYVQIFQAFLASAGTTIKSKTESSKGNNSIIISINEDIDEDLGMEGYTLDVKENSIEIAANEAPGIFNALQTLRQLLPKEIESQGELSMGLAMISGCKIKDYPRLPWRGLMFDVSRHFFSVEDVKAYLDKMSQYKLNVFHWHLTDDEGWRIEIKSLPKLTEIGAWRVERNGRFGEDRPYPKEGEKATYGGFYTHEQIKDIVQYASDRNITVVPEIDMPGHAMAILAAYPELSTLKEPKFVNPGSRFADWTGPHFVMLIENTLDPTNEEVYTFVEKVMDEVAELFPGEYIHMGGDECYKGYWERSEAVQDFMKKNNIEDAHKLQSYFVERVQKIITAKGKKMIGWDEILEGGLSDGASVMSWQGMKGGIEAAKMGHNVVMSPTTFTYLDYTQGDPSLENKIYANLSLKKAYSFEPVPENTDPKYIIGAQANLWTEVIPNIQYAFHMTYPRAFALAETAWSPKELKNWSNFESRTESHFARFESANKSISKAILDPIVNVSKSEDKLILSLSSDANNVEIFYTLDNTYPVKYGQKYTEPVVIPEGDLSLRTQSFRNGKAIGRMIQIHRSELVNRSN